MVSVQTLPVGSNYQFLRRFCLSPDEGWRDAQRWQTRTQFITVSETEGRTPDEWSNVWSIATDGRIMMALRDGGIGADHQADRTEGNGFLGRGSAIDTIRKLLTAEPREWHYTTLPDLWSWCEAYHRHRCSSCEFAYPATMGEVPCDDCDGTRWNQGPPTLGVRRGVVAGVIVDRDRLLKVLDAGLYDRFGGECRYGFMPTPRTQAPSTLFIEHPQRQWRVVVMGMADPAIYPGQFDEPLSARKPYPVYVPGLGEIWHARHAAPYAVADWLIDHGQPETGFVAELMGAK